MKKPNILWIYCDQLRKDALSCYGNDKFPVSTPNIDSIANSGVMFTNCYCNSPVSVPSRTSIIAGLYTKDTGVYNNEGCSPDFVMPKKVTTFPEIFASNGYKTANFGKSHLPVELKPWQSDDNTGSKMIDFDQYNLKESVYLPGMPVIIGGDFPEDMEYPSNQVTNNAVDWILEQKDSFFLRVSYLQPHTPVVTQQRYKNFDISPKIIRSPVSESDLSSYEKNFSDLFQMKDLNPKDLATSICDYYSLVNWLDEQVGILLNTLKKKNLYQNTIVIFTTDHGLSLWENGAYEKHVFSPNSHGVPFLISYPQLLESSKNDTLCESLDLAKTLLGLCKIQIPDHLKGRDIFRELEPEFVFSSIGFGNAESRALPYLQLGEWPTGGGWPRRSCIRSRRYRFEKNTRKDGVACQIGDGCEDLFFTDNDKDPDEKINLIKDPRYAQIISRLNKKLDFHESDCIEPESVNINQESWGNW